MWGRFKLFILKNLYRLLIIKISFVDKHNLLYYDKFRTFCQLSVASNKGDFIFIFKEDRRRYVRERAVPKILSSSYFVELVSPTELDNGHNVFKDKVAVVIKIRIGVVNYEALAKLLLDLYIDTFSEH